MLDGEEDSATCHTTGSSLSGLLGSSSWVGWRAEEGLLVLVRSAWLLGGHPYCSRSRLLGLGEVCLLWSRARPPFLPPGPGRLSGALWNQLSCTVNSRNSIRLISTLLATRNQACRFRSSGTVLGLVPLGSRRTAGARASQEGGWLGHLDVLRHWPFPLLKGSKAGLGLLGHHLDTTEAVLGFFSPRKPQR